MSLLNLLSCSSISEDHRSWLEDHASELGESSPATRWMYFLANMPNKLSFREFLECWKQLVPATAETDASRPIWFPTEESWQTPLGQWMQSAGFQSPQEFHRWSITERESFTAEAIERLNILFQSQPETILSQNKHNGNPTWLSGAELNIVESCFQASESQLAIVAGTDGSVERTLTYGELQRLSAQVANGLRENQFKPGDTIGVFMPMTLESVAIYLGIIAAGCSVVSIADSFAAPEIKRRLELTNTRAVFTYDHVTRLGKPLSLYNRVVEAGARQAIVLHGSNVDSHGEDSNLTKLRSQDIEFDRLLSSNADLNCYTAKPDDTINILFSSGTTGDPKCIPWTHTTPIKCAIDGMLLHGIQQGDVVCWPTNLGWMMGPWLIFATLLRKGTIALHEDAPVGERFGSFVENAKVNMLGVVPTLVRNWRATQCMEPANWSSIRCFSSTGESSQAEDMTYLSYLAGGKPIIEYCGGTEIGGGYISSNLLAPNFPAAFNTPAFGIDIRILDETGNEAEEGELYLVPPSIGLSERLLHGNHDAIYFQDVPPQPDGTRLRKHGDFFRRIGDSLYVAGGRVDDTMNLGGIKVSSAEIERTLNQISEVAETAAVAVEEEQGGASSLVIFVVLDSKQVASQTDESGLLKQMNERIKKELNPLFKISSIQVVDSLPRTASNKVMRRMLRSDLK